MKSEYGEQPSILVHRRLNVSYSSRPHRDATLCGRDLRRSRKIAVQLEFQGTRVHSFCNGDDGLQRHLLNDLPFAQPDPELSGPGKKRRLADATP
jgi:hypothetical protein